MQLENLNSSKFEAFKNDKLSFGVVSDYAVKGRKSPDLQYTTPISSPPAKN